MAWTGRLMMNLRGPNSKILERRKQSKLKMQSGMKLEKRIAKRKQSTDKERGWNISKLVSLWPVFLLLAQNPLGNEPQASSLGGHPSSILTAQEKAYGSQLWLEKAPLHRPGSQMGLGPSVDQRESGLGSFLALERKSLSPAPGISKPRGGRKGAIDGCLPLCGFLRMKLSERKMELRERERGTFLMTLFMSPDSAIPEVKPGCFY